MIQNITKMVMWICICIVVLAHLVYSGIILARQVKDSSAYTYEKGYALSTDLIVGDPDIGATLLYRTKFQYKVEETGEYYTQYEYTLFNAKYKVGNKKTYRVYKGDYVTEWKDPTLIVVTMVFELMVIVFGVLIISRRDKAAVI